MVSWHVRRGGTRLRGVAPLMDDAAASTWRGKRPRQFYTEGFLMWVCPVRCSQVFLWPDLTQPGGEVHCSKPVRGKSKGKISWSTAIGLGRTGALGGSIATGASHRALIHAEWCGGMSEEAARVSGVCPPHGRCCRRHLEGGNGRVRSTRRGSCCGSGPDVAPKCSYGLT